MSSNKYEIKILFGQETQRIKGIREGKRVFVIDKVIDHWRLAEKSRSNIMTRIMRSGSIDVI